MRASRVNMPVSRSPGVNVSSIFFQCSGDSQLAGVGLAVDSAALDAHNDIHLISLAGLFQRRNHSIALLKVAEVLFQRSSVDYDIAGSGTNAHSGYRRFPPSRAQKIGGLDCHEYPLRMIYSVLLDS